MILFSEGFAGGKILGRKLVAIFTLCRELLTPQQHYDWGLRALKTVLRGCGQTLQTSRQKLEAGEGASSTDKVGENDYVHVKSKFYISTVRGSDR